MPLNPSQALTLISPWRLDQLDFFRNYYKTNLEFRSKVNLYISEYIKDPEIFVNADYSQAEVRCAAELSGEENLLNLYFKQAEEEAKGVDISEIKELDYHYYNASQVYEKPIEKITKWERKFAKTITFAVLYGAGAFLISETSGVTMLVAEKLLANFWKKNPKLLKWVYSLLSEAIEFGYVTTPLGRRKAAPHLKGKTDILKYFIQGANFYEKEIAESLGGYANVRIFDHEIRQIRNFPVQGHTSDIVISGIHLFKLACKKENIPIKIHILVHDSVGLSVPYSFLPRTLVLLRENMEKKVAEEFKFKCPLRVDMEIGFSYETKVKVPFLLARLTEKDYNDLQQKCYQEFLKLKTETVISALSENSLYLFKEEQQKPKNLTSKQLKIANLTNKKFAMNYEEYHKRWNLFPDILENFKHLVAPTVVGEYAKVEEIFMGV